MRPKPFAILLILVLLCSSAAFAQGGPPVGQPGEVSAVAPVAAPADAPVAPVAPEIAPVPAAPAPVVDPAPAPGSGLSKEPLTAAEVAAQGAAAVAAAKELTDASGLNGAAKRKAIFVGLAGVFVFLIWFLRRVTVLFLNEQVVIAFAALLGVVVLFLTNAGMGLPFWQSVDIALAGPAALALHALSKLPRPSKWLKAKEEAAEKADNPAV